MKQVGRPMTMAGLGRLVVYDPLHTPLYASTKPGDSMLRTGYAGTPVFPSQPLFWR